MKLQVLICTLGKAGLERVAAMHMPQIDGIGYIVSCQAEPMPLQASLQRDDIIVDFSPTIGLSNNRNNAFRIATAPYALIADDDLIWQSDGLNKIVDCFEQHPDIDIATFVVKGLDKVYPESEWDLGKPYKKYNVASVEIAVRISSLRDKELSMSPKMGLGADYFTSGEEELFLLQAQKAGLKGRFFPVAICEHPHLTTGTRNAQKPGVLRASGAIITLKYPFTAILRLPLKALRVGGNPLRNLIYLLQGALKSHTLLNP